MFGGNMSDLMKQAQKVQEQLQKQQEEIANQEVTGESGAGTVKQQQGCQVLLVQDQVRGLGCKPLTLRRRCQEREG